MSSDLRNHPVGYFAYPLLSRYDRDRFDVYCYSFYEGSPSPAQAQIGKQVTGYRWWPGRTSEQVAEGIAADNLDILFELGAVVGIHASVSGTKIIQSLREKMPLQKSNDRVLRTPRRDI